MYERPLVQIDGDCLLFEQGITLVLTIQESMDAEVDLLAKYLCQVDTLRNSLGWQHTSPDNT